MQLDHAPRSSSAWLRFSATGRWDVAWDPATNVPSRIWGAGIPVSGDVVAFAKQMLADHIDLLAPGASASDFTLVSNHFDGNIRSIGFLQHHGGRRVVGGQVSFRFKNDRLFVIGSEALPDVRVSLPKSRLAKTTLTAPLRAKYPTARITAGDEVVLPLVADAGVLGYRIAAPVTIEAGVDGKYLAYVDPAGGDVIVEEQLHQTALGTVLYRGVDRHPLRGRVDKPARTARVSIAGTEATTGADGTISWTPDAPQTLTTNVIGNQVEIVNKGSTGTPTTTQLTIAPNGQVIWDASSNSEDDAQVNTYIAVNAVKDFVRANLDENMPGLNDPIKANVNIGKPCNAFFDGTTINFFTASQSCQNTGLLEDVIYHEYGHAVHSAEIVMGVGRFDGAMSEGAADFLSATITNDPGMGRGFFYSDEPLRHLDPTGDEFRWPDDLGEIHGTGRIYGGALWDLRKVLPPATVNKLFVGTLRRATSIPTSFIEALATDDDDGNLDNGTPNECAIREAFGRHGLRMATGTLEAPPSTLVTDAATTQVTFKLAGISTRCPAADAIDKVLVLWLPGASRVPAAGQAFVTAFTPGTYSATLPLPQDDVLSFSARVMFTDGSTLTLADNLADRYYQLYRGETKPLYCTSFDTDPFKEGWQTGTADGSPTPWAWVNGQLEMPGDYVKEKRSFVELPPIFIDRYSDVHLQYRRHLEVEDSQFDKARITVDGAQAWINGTANRGDSSSFHHIDREWRFHDVRVTGLTQGQYLNIAFELSSDAGLEFGGWTIDDLCVVANPNSICGDGVVSFTEGCDEGAKNGDRPNACRSWCAKPKCGDTIVDDMEECDHGPGGSKECTPMCRSLVEVGCCSSAGPERLWPAIFVGVLLMRRRKCSRSQKRSRPSSAA